jgi:hypothetical protein
MDLEKVATLFGLPGLMLGLWYLLATAQNRRLAEQDKSRAELEEKRIAAMTVGFQTLGAIVNDHTKVDLQHHGKVSESIAELHGKLDGLLDATDRFTPVGSVPIPRTPRSVERQTPPRGSEYVQHRRDTTRNEDE